MASCVSRSIQNLAVPDWNNSENASTSSSSARATCLMCASYSEQLGSRMQNHCVPSVKPAHVSCNFKFGAACHLRCQSQRSCCTNTASTASGIVFCTCLQSSLSTASAWHRCRPRRTTASAVSKAAADYSSSHDTIRENTWQQQQQQQQVPRIIPIPSTLLPSLLPATGSGSQVVQHLGGIDAWFRRFMVSLGGSIVLYNVNVLLTAVVALFWAWQPIWAAASENLQLRWKYPVGGLWRARLLDHETEDFGGRWSIVVGDSSGMSLEMSVPAPRGSVQLRRGELVELVVLSDDPSFSRFKVLREAFFPERGLWLAQDPCLEQSAYETYRRDIMAFDKEDREDSEEEDMDGMYSLMSDSNLQDRAQYAADDKDVFTSMNDDDYSITSLESHMRATWASSPPSGVDTMSEVTSLPLLFQDGLGEVDSSLIRFKDTS